MEEQTNYALFVDGKLHELVPMDLFESRLQKFGVNKPEDVYKLLSGQRVRTLGKTYYCKPEQEVHDEVAKFKDNSASEPVILPAAMPVKQSKSLKADKRITHDTPYGEEIGELQKRSSRLGKIGLMLAGLSSLGTMCAYAFAMLASSAEPTHVIETISIPAEIAKLIAETSGSSGVGISSQFASTTDSMIRSILESTFFKLLSGLCVLMGIGVSVFRSSIMPFIAVLPIIIGPTLITSLLSEDSGPNHRAYNGVLSVGIARAVDEQNGPELERMLKSHDHIDDNAKTYLLAQVYASGGVKHSSVTLTAKDIREGNVKPNGQVAFAIESVANDGDTSSLSPPATSYFREAAEQAEAWKGRVIIPKVFGMITAVGAICFAMTSLYVRRRLSSIYRLLQQIN